MVLERPASGWRPVAAAIVWGLSMMMAGKTPAADNLSFVGNLVAQACSIRPGDEAIELLFDDQSSHYLYLNTRTQSVPFYIHLVGCDTSIANTVTALFSGVENTELPGLLALATGSRARGIAIGLESAAGVCARRAQSDSQPHDPGRALQRCFNLYAGLPLTF